MMRAILFVSGFIVLGSLSAQAHTVDNGPGGADPRMIQGPQQPGATWIDPCQPGTRAVWVRLPGQVTPQESSKPSTPVPSPSPSPSPAPKEEPKPEPVVKGNPSLGEGLMTSRCTKCHAIPGGNYTIQGAFDFVDSGKLPIADEAKVATCKAAQKALTEQEKADLLAHLIVKGAKPAKTLEKK